MTVTNEKKIKSSISKIELYSRELNENTSNKQSFSLFVSTNAIVFQTYAVVNMLYKFISMRYYLKSFHCSSHALTIKLTVPFQTYSGSEIVFSDW